MTAEQTAKERAETCPLREKVNFMEIRIKENAAAISSMRSDISAVKDDISAVKGDTKVTRQILEERYPRKTSSGANKPVSDNSISPVALKIILTLGAFILLLLGFTGGQTWPS